MLPAGIGVATATYTGNQMGANKVLSAKVHAFIGNLMGVKDRIFGICICVNNLNEFYIDFKKIDY